MPRVWHIETVGNAISRGCSCAPTTASRQVAPGVLETIEPDMRLLASVECRGVLVTCKGDGGEPAAGGSGSVDFKSRFFAPRAGIDEDPVTGSAHACLAPYWSEKLGR